MTIKTRNKITKRTAVDDSDEHLENMMDGWMYFGIWLTKVPKVNRKHSTKRTVQRTQT
jgi:hypothetical protein